MSCDCWLIRSRNEITIPFITISLRRPWMHEERPAPYHGISVLPLFCYNGLLARSCIFCPGIKLFHYCIIGLVGYVRKLSTKGLQRLIKSLVHPLFNRRQSGRVATSRGNGEICNAIRGFFNSKITVIGDECLGIFLSQFTDVYLFAGRHWQL